MSLIYECRQTLISGQPEPSKKTRRKKNVLIPTRPGGTRFVGHLNTALKNIIRSYHPIALHLTQVSELSNMGLPYLPFWFKNSAPPPPPPSVLSVFVLCHSLLRTVEIASHAPKRGGCKAWEFSLKYSRNYLKKKLDKGGQWPTKISWTALTLYLTVAAFSRCHNNGQNKGNGNPKQVEIEIHHILPAFYGGCHRAPHTTVQSNAETRRWRGLFGNSGGIYSGRARETENKVS